MKHLLTSCVLLGVSVVCLTGGERDGKDKEPEVKGLKLTLRNKKDSYKLDLGGKTAKEWEELLEVGKKLGSPLPKPPAVDLELEIQNVGKESIDFWSAGDPVQVVLEMKGPNAKTTNAPLAFTADFRLPKFMTLEPGKTHVIPIKSLSSGFRGTGTWHYWLAPGEYTITPKFKTGIRPVPPGAKELYGGAPVTVVGEGTKVKVEN